MASMICSSNFSVASAEGAYYIGRTLTLIGRQCRGSVRPYRHLPPYKGHVPPIHHRIFFFFSSCIARSALSLPPAPSTVLLSQTGHGPYAPLRVAQLRRQTPHSSAELCPTDRSTRSPLISTSPTPQQLQQNHLGHCYRQALSHPPPLSLRVPHSQKAKVSPLVAPH